MEEWRSDPLFQTAKQLRGEVKLTLYGVKTSLVCSKSSAAVVECILTLSFDPRPSFTRFFTFLALGLGYCLSPK